jgi:hypothetical protein
MQQGPSQTAISTATYRAAFMLLDRYLVGRADGLNVAAYLHMIAARVG